MNEPSTPEPGRPPRPPARPTPKQVQQELHWSERWREKLREGSWWRRRYDSFFLPVEEPTRFTESHEALVKQLMPRAGDGTPDEARAKEVLEEARAVYASAEERKDGAERRATTLQGAVAIAASLVLAGGALLADPSKLHGDGWRLLLALALISAVFSLVMAGARALASTSRIHVFHSPTPTDMMRRSRLPPAQARIELAAETLKDYGHNTKIADWKVAHLRAAAEWFSRALVALLVLGILLGGYAVFGPTAPPPEEGNGGTGKSLEGAAHLDDPRYEAVTLSPVAVRLAKERVSPSERSLGSRTPAAVVRR